MHPPDDYVSPASLRPTCLPGLAQAGDSMCTTRSVTEWVRSPGPVTAPHPTGHTHCSLLPSQGRGLPKLPPAHAPRSSTFTPILQRCVPLSATTVPAARGPARGKHSCSPCRAPASSTSLSWGRGGGAGTHKRSRHLLSTGAATRGSPRRHSQEGSGKRSSCDKAPVSPLPEHLLGHPTHLSWTP